MQMSIVPKVNEIVLAGLDKAREANPDLEEAYETYVAQYGKDKISVSDPFNLSDTVDPAVLVLGRNCTIFYSENSNKLKGRLGSLTLKQGEVYIIGRREPQDSKLVVWSSSGQVELETYNASVGTILSRIHAAIVFTEHSQVLFTDLGSSSGSVIVGESKTGGAFVRVYDPGTGASPSIRFDKVQTTKHTS